MDDCQAKKLCSGASEDRISSLPWNIVDTILVKLPFEKAVRTSVLSPTWRYMWTTLPALALDSRFYLSLRRNDQEFVGIIDKALLLHSSPIVKASLSIHNSNQFPDMDQWILFLSRKGIQSFNLANTSASLYKMTSHILSCVELMFLELRGCILSPPTALKSFRNLTELRLFKVALSNSAFLGFISSCPLLKTLFLLLCTGLDRIEIRAKNLNCLRVSCEFETICFPDAPNLTLVSILMHNEVSRGAGHTEPSTMVSVMSSLTIIEKLTLGIRSHKLFSSGGVPRRLPIELKELKELELFEVDFNDAGDVACILCLIQSSPNLSVLDITANGRGAEDISKEEDDVLWKDMEESNLRELKCVVLSSVRGIRTEMNLIKFLLLHSPLLISMFVEYDKVLSETAQLMMAKAFLEFQRSSSRAVIVLEDPPLEEA